MVDKKAWFLINYIFTSTSFLLIQKIWWVHQFKMKPKFLLRVKAKDICSVQRKLIRGGQEYLSRSAVDYRSERRSTK